MVELDRAGLRTSELSRVLVARTVNNGNTCVVRFKTAPDQAKFLQPAASSKNYSNFTSLTGNYRYGYFADSTTLILADKEPAIQALREKGAKAKLPGDLQSMVEKVRGPIWRASGRLNAENATKLAQEDDGFTIRAGASAGTAAWLITDGRMADVRFERSSTARPGQASAACSGYSSQRPWTTSAGWPIARRDDGGCFGHPRRLRNRGRERARESPPSCGCRPGSVAGRGIGEELIRDYTI